MEIADCITSPAKSAPRERFGANCTRASTKFSIDDAAIHAGRSLRKRSVQVQQCRHGLPLQGELRSIYGTRLFRSRGDDARRRARIAENAALFHGQFRQSQFPALVRPQERDRRGRSAGYRRFLIGAKPSEIYLRRAAPNRTTGPSAARRTRVRKRGNTHHQRGGTPRHDHHGKGAGKGGV